MSSERRPAIRARSLGKSFRHYPRHRDRLMQLFSQSGTRYQSHWALRGLDLDVHAGESVAVLGRNGSGKSTLLQLLCGTLFPTEGEIWARGRVAPLLELGAGFHPDFTGRENVVFAASLQGLTRAEIEERFDAIAAFADIGGAMERPVRHYSSGMWARLAFSVAAHVDADILVIDEWLAVGDAEFAQKCLRFLREFRERGTLLFASHDPNAVLSLCDRAVWLEGGSVRAIGAAPEVLGRYQESIREADDAPAPPLTALPPVEESKATG